MLNYRARERTVSGPLDPDTVLMDLNDRLQVMISRWVARELGGPNISRKLVELLVFNTLLIYSGSDASTEFKKFFFKRNSVNEGNNEDFIVERIEGLYSVIRMTFPDWFISDKERSFLESIEELGYTSSVPDSGQHGSLGWLLHQLQHTMRYYHEPVSTKSK